MPFENSSNGSVVFTLDQFADRAAEFPDLSVCAEAYLDVHHCLLGHCGGSAIPKGGQRSIGRNLSHIKRIYSHPQAFGQCVKFLRTHLRGVETIDVSSTSRAAELALADKTGESAAVSSRAAAKLLGLEILAGNIEDRDDNTTRFFVLRRGGSTSDSKDPEWLEERRRKRRREAIALSFTRILPQKRRADAETEAEDQDEPKAPAYSHAKSLASFTVPHRHPGALADVLDCFRRARLNLTSINSRPSLAAPFQYVFFVEFEGHRSDDPEGRVRDVLQDVARVASSSRWLGSWESMR